MTSPLGKLGWATDRLRKAAVTYAATEPAGRWEAWDALCDAAQAYADARTTFAEHLNTPHQPAPLSQEGRHT